jgi:hypothetical protein
LTPRDTGPRFLRMPRSYEVIDADTHVNPQSREVIARTLGGLPADERHRIVCGLAKELYHVG